jgi:Zn-dependent protease
MDQYPQSPREDARVGLAGPLWGLAAAVAAYGVHLLTAAPIWAAIARSAGWLNLFNLLPIWQLDGGRGFRALSTGQRWLVTAAMAGLWLATGEGLLALLALAGAFRAWADRGAAEPDATTFYEFLFLLATLSALCLIPLDVPARE